jgi:hypothetical protein
MCGGGEEVVPGGDLDDLAEVHDRDPVGDVPYDAQVVRDEQHRQAAVADQVRQQVQHLGLDRHVQRRDRLVGHHELR